MLKEFERIFTREVLEADEISSIPGHDCVKGDKTFVPSDQWLREYVLRYWKCANDAQSDAVDFLKSATSPADFQLRLRCFSYLGKYGLRSGLLDAIYGFIMTGKEIQ